MTAVIGIVDYGVAGNVHSIKKAIEQAGGNVRIIESPDDFKCVDKIVIPGVGSFKDAMNELKSDGLLEPLKMAALKVPTLGICLGMQILASVGFEYGKNKGLGLIKAEVCCLNVEAIVPHVGFNSLDVIKESSLLDGLGGEDFYFMHSYEVVSFHDVLSTTIYEGHMFVSAVQNGNLYGVQFHPEKSRDAGIQLFRNFIEL